MTRGRSLVPSLFLAGVAALVLAAATPPPEAPAPVPAGEVPPPLAVGPAPDLNLVFTSQVAGWIEPCG